MIRTIAKCLVLLSTTMTSFIAHADEQPSKQKGYVLAWVPKKADATTYITF